MQSDEHMLIEHQEFLQLSDLPSQWPLDHVLRYCRIAGFSIDGKGIDGALIYCTMEDMDWYWSLFNTAQFHRVEFKRCIFRGCSFRGCQLVDCTFEDCRFILDNLGGTCTIDDTLFAECTFRRCEVVNTRFDGKRDPVVEKKVRWYGCRQVQCKGLEGLF